MAQNILFFPTPSCAAGIPQADLQKQVQREKALAEAEGRIKEARDNEDVNRRCVVWGVHGAPTGFVFLCISMKWKMPFALSVTCKAATGCDCYLWGMGGRGGVGAAHAPGAV